MVTKTFIDLGSAEAGFPAWQKSNKAWQVRAAQRSGRVRRTEAHPDVVLLRRGFYPFGRSWGGQLRADQDVRARPAVADDLRLDSTRSRPVRRSRPRPAPDARGPPGNGKPSPKP